MVDGGNSDHRVILMFLYSSMTSAFTLQTRKRLFSVFRDGAIRARDSVVYLMCTASLNSLGLHLYEQHCIIVQQTNTLELHGGSPFV